MENNYSNINLAIILKILNFYGSFDVLFFLKNNLKELIFNGLIWIYF